MMRLHFDHIRKRLKLFSGIAVLLLSLTFSIFPQTVHAEQGNFDRHPVPPGSAPQFIASGPDGAVWSTELTNKIAHVTMDGTLTEIDIPDPDGIGLLFLTGITAGPDGNMWVAEQNGNHIDRVTMAGVVTKFDMSADGLGAPTGIVTGPDGNIWFTATNGVGKITTAGVVTSYLNPDPGNPPSNYDIAVGADGNLWIVAQNSNRIGRITPDGVLTEFDVPTPDSRPTAIVQGFDGNMWFTEGLAGRVGKITPAGVITEYALPAQLPNPFGITRGYGQDLWVIDSTTGAVAKITPDGTITVQPTAGPLFGSHLTTGPDGNLWFAENDGVSIESVTRMEIDAIPPVIGPLPSTLTPDTTTLSGTINEPGSTLVLTLGDGSTINTTSDATTGNFTFNLPPGSLHVGDVLSISATDLSNNTTLVPLQITVVAPPTTPSPPTPTPTPTPISTIPGLASVSAVGSNKTLTDTGFSATPLVLTCAVILLLATAWLTQRTRINISASKK